VNASFLAIDDDLIRETTLDMENQRVIRADCERTRLPGGSDHKLILEQMLTYYCKEMDMKYKQGMNEVFSPFLILHIESSNLVSIADTY
jgi:hypothetical protein